MPGVDRAFSQGHQPVHGAVNQGFELIARFVAADVDQLGSLGFDADLGQEASHGLHPHLGAEVALRQMAIALGAGDDAQPADAAFDGVHQVLSVHLAAARDLADQDVRALLAPLSRQPLALGDAVAADVDNNIGSHHRP